MATEPNTFLELPPEIRNRIYALVVAHNEPVILSPVTNGLPHYQPGITRVNRQTRNESLQMFYHFAKFTFRPPATRLNWKGDVPKGMDRALATDYALAWDFRSREQRIEIARRRALGLL